MKEVSVTLWELTVDEVQELARIRPAERILVHDKFFKLNQLLKAQTASKRTNEKDLIFLALEEPKGLNT